MRMAARFHCVLISSLRFSFFVLLYIFFFTFNPCFHFPCFVCFHVFSGGTPQEITRTASHARHARHEHRTRCPGCAGVFLPTSNVVRVLSCACVRVHVCICMKTNLYDQLVADKEVVETQHHVFSFRFHLVFTFLHLIISFLCFLFIFPLFHFPLFCISSILPFCSFSDVFMCFPRAPAAKQEQQDTGSAHSYTGGNHARSFARTTRTRARDTIS